uniref:Shedu protein SduA C-terminal domain-containing protein n=1 Tax=Cyanothece sp. (strain PCC 7425 / ATCC 29141) TaxID=395961 RepID=B8HR01_CYAP4
MITLSPSKLDINQCDQQIHELQSFLTANSEIEETGGNGLQKFFSDRPNLILLLGSWSYGLVPAFYGSEVSLFNEFRADFVVASVSHNKFVFIEFEDAKQDSIFKLKSRGPANTSYEWSNRYEHGLSQVIDWYYRMDDYERTNKFEEYFGYSQISYTGLLVIGRDQFIQQTGLMKRFRWRSSKTIINSRPLHCMTFDQLLAESREKLSTLKADDQLE